MNKKKYAEAAFVPVVAGYYDRADMLATTPPDPVGHRHCVCEIMYVVEGACTVRVGACRHPLTARQYIWIDEGVAHQLLLNEETPCAMMNVEYFFRKEPLGGMTTRSLAASYAPFGDWLRSDGPCRVLSDEDGRVFSLLKQTVALADSAHARAEPLCSMLTSILTLLMARSARRGADEGRGRDCVKRAMERMRKGLDEPLTSAGLAAELGLNPSYFARLFRDTAGVTPSSYLTGLRVERAKELLVKTDKSVLEIAAETGFAWQQHFSQVFRRETGYSPTAYRRNFG